MLWLCEKVEAHRSQCDPLSILEKRESVAKSQWEVAKLFTKKVDAAFRDKISDLILENELSISEFALEKDFIVTDVLQAISKINNEKFNLVFCGGTCLSKAYGLLERVSEDVDIKLVPKLGVVLNANQRRTAISRLKKDIVQALLNIGFEEGNIQQIALDGNTCVEFNAEYSTYFDVDPAMRAAMKLELNYTNLSLPSVDMDIQRKLSIAIAPGKLMSR